MLGPIDLLIENELIVETKAVEDIEGIHEAQLLLRVSVLSTVDDHRSSPEISFAPTGATSIFHSGNIFRAEICAICVG